MVNLVAFIPISCQLHPPLLEKKQAEWDRGGSGQTLQMVWEDQDAAEDSSDAKVEAVMDWRRRLHGLR